MPFAIHGSKIENRINSTLIGESPVPQKAKRSRPLAIAGCHKAKLAPERISDRYVGSTSRPAP